MSLPRYYMRKGMLFCMDRGSERRILSFCIDDPDQGPVVWLPIIPVRGTAYELHTGRLNAPPPLQLNISRHEDCDCMSCLPWTY